MRTKAGQCGLIRPGEPEFTPAMRHIRFNCQRTSRWGWSVYRVLRGCSALTNAAFTLFALRRALDSRIPHTQCKFKTTQQSICHAQRGILKTPIGVSSLSPQYMLPLLRTPKGSYDHSPAIHRRGHSQNSLVPTGRPTASPLSLCVF